MGAGKTSLGKALAESLNLPFFDLDHLIESDHGDSVSELILNKGELYFRQLERKVLEKALQKEQFVLAHGGGTPCYYDNMELINAQSLSIYLERSINDLSQTLGEDRKERPLIAHLNDGDLKEFIAKHLFERRPFYEKAIFKLSQKQKDPAARLQAILEYIQ